MLYNICKVIECPLYDIEKQKCSYYEQVSNCHLQEEYKQSNVESPLLESEYGLMAFRTIKGFCRVQFKNHNIELIQLKHKNKEITLTSYQYWEICRFRKEYPILLCEQIECPHLKNKACSKYEKSKDCHLLKDGNFSYKPLHWEGFGCLSVQIKVEDNFLNVAYGGKCLYLEMPLSKEQKKWLTAKNVKLI